jgi:hypothetical protein
MKQANEGLVKSFAKFSSLRSHHHGQFFRPLDPILFNATMVRHRSVSLPSLFRGDDYVAKTSQVDHYRAPCGHRRIASLLPTSVGWDDCRVSVEV